MNHTYSRFIDCPICKGEDGCNMKAEAREVVKMIDDINERETPIDYMRMLTEFHRKFGHYEFFGYSVDDEVIELRKMLIDEEVNKELLPALERFKSEFENHKQWIDAMTELADALADSLYVIFGTCVSMGVPIDKVFAEVHRSNMTKSMLKDTKSIKGKTLKGDNFEPPRIREIIEKGY